MIIHVKAIQEPMENVTSSRTEGFYTRYTFDNKSVLFTQRGTNLVPFVSLQLWTYTWVIPSGGSRGAAESLFLLQSKMWTFPCPFGHEQGAGQEPRAEALAANNVKKRAQRVGQPSAILKDFLPKAT